MPWRRIHIARESQNCSDRQYYHRIDPESKHERSHHGRQVVRVHIDSRKRHQQQKSRKTESNEDRIHALMNLGYLKREAEFVCLAALHSGFFLRRQYREYRGTKPGYADKHLLARLINLRHCRILTLGPRTQVCHLSSRPLYARIGEPDNRHRRMRSGLSIKVKLMALDYVLAHSEVPYLATEEEKVDFFCGRLGIGKSRLPTKTYRSKTGETTTDRYFVEKFPVVASKHDSHEVRTWP